MENLPRDLKEEWHKGERSQLITHQDNLRTEGNFETEHNYRENFRVQHKHNMLLERDLA